MRGARHPGPRLELAKDAPDANVYALLIAALLERGEPMTLEEVAGRFEIAGVAEAGEALRSLKRCRPARPPVYRDGDLYHLDPHDHEADLWAFRLGLRPPKVRHAPTARAPLPPLPGPDVPLSIEELDEAFRERSLYSFSQQRLALAVLDAHGRPMAPQEVVDFVAERTSWHLLHADVPHFSRKGAAVRVLEDGRWAVATDAPPERLTAARKAVRGRVEAARRRQTPRLDPADLERLRRDRQAEKAARAAELSRLSRVLVHGYPARNPEVVALLDVGRRTLETFVGDEVAQVPERLAGFDVVGAIDVRRLLGGLGFDPGTRRLAELGPPQKTMKLNKRGRTLKITTELLIRGTCGISRPLGDPARLDAYLQKRQEGALRRRLAADVKSLYALYRYGLLHGYVRLRWGFIDDRLPVPWVHRDEEGLYELMDVARETGRPLEVVVGSAPGWEDPWSRARLVKAVRPPRSWSDYLVDAEGNVLGPEDVQLARLSGAHVTTS